MLNACSILHIVLPMIEIQRCLPCLRMAHLPHSPDANSLHIGICGGALECVSCLFGTLARSLVSVWRLHETRSRQPYGCVRKHAFALAVFLTWLALPFDPLRYGGAILGVMLVVVGGFSAFALFFCGFRCCCLSGLEQMPVCLPICSSRCPSFTREHREGDGRGCSVLQRLSFPGPARQAMPGCSSRIVYGRTRYSSTWFIGSCRSSKGFIDSHHSTTDAVGHVATWINRMAAYGAGVDVDRELHVRAVRIPSTSRGSLQVSCCGWYCQWMAFALVSILVSGCGGNYGYSRILAR